MSLFNRMMVPCVFMVPERTPDGSGGNKTNWIEGKALEAAIIRDSSTEAKIADASGTVEKYTITVSRSVLLEYHAVIKRLSDGKIFRITSDSVKAPDCTALDIAQATAEGWKLT